MMSLIDTVHYLFQVVKPAGIVDKAWHWVEALSACTFEVRTQ